MLSHPSSRAVQAASLVMALAAGAKPAAAEEGHLRLKATNNPADFVTWIRAMDVESARITDKARRNIEITTGVNAPFTLEVGCPPDDFGYWDLKIDLDARPDSGDVVIVRKAESPRSFGDGRWTVAGNGPKRAGVHKTAQVECVKRGAGTDGITGTADDTADRVEVLTLGVKAVANGVVPGEFSRGGNPAGHSHADDADESGDGDDGTDVPVSVAAGVALTQSLAVRDDKLRIGARIRVSADPLTWARISAGGRYDRVAEELRGPNGNRIHPAAVFGADVSGGLCPVVVENINGTKVDLRFLAELGLALVHAPGFSEDDGRVPGRTGPGGRAAAGVLLSGDRVGVIVETEYNFAPTMDLGNSFTPLTVSGTVTF